MPLYVPASGPNATISFNGTGSAIGAVQLGQQNGLAFVRLELPLGATVQVRVLSDLVIAGAPELGIESLITEANYAVDLYREVEPGNFLLSTVHFGRFKDDPYLPGRTAESIVEFDFPVTASTRDPHSALLGKGAFYLVIDGQAAPMLLDGFLSGRIAIEVSADTDGPVGPDPRAVLFGANWLQPYGEGPQAPPGGPVVGPGGGTQPPPTQGTAGNDQFFGGAGNDSYDGGGGQDYIRGGEGNDTLKGGAAFDDVHGNQGDDVVMGGLDNDWVVGGKGDDILYGEDGLDVVLGNIGNDTIDGGTGSDTVRGGQGHDIVRGGAGDDYVSGDRGDDTVTGGAGADAFHSFGEAGLDRVTDFNRAEGDYVRLDPGTQYSVSQQGADVVINMTGGGQMVLVGVSLSSLTPGWIVVG